MFGREEKVSSTRLTAVQYIILAVFLVLAYGLWRLQVMQSDKYSQLAEMNRIRNVPILAPRGKILDREGRVIVDNYPSFSALLLRDSSRDLNADADLIAQGLHLTPEEVRLRLKRFASMPRYQPIFLKEDITPDELAFIESHKNELPELDTIMAHRRLYPRNGFVAHLIGYVGEVTEDMLNQPQFELYSPGDVVGVSGVEKQYNQILMGKNGSRRALVNSRGREVGRLDETAAIPGCSEITPRRSSAPKTPAAATTRQPAATATTFSRAGPATTRSMGRAAPIPRSIPATLPITASFATPTAR